MIILDTDVVMEILDKKSNKGDEALEKIPASKERISITSITLHELIYRLEKYAKPAHKIMQIPVMGYSKEDAVLSAKLELGAEKSGVPIRRTDAMIAAVAINRTNGCTEREYWYLSYSGNAVSDSEIIESF